MLENAPIYAVLPCVDLEGARRFYGEVLGLKEAEIPGEGGDEGQDAAIFECGQATRLLVYQRATPTKADHTAAGWLVDVLDAVVDALMAKGVMMEVYDIPDFEFDDRGIATGAGFRGAWFKDPEGNILAISEAF